MLHDLLANLNLDNVKLDIAGDGTENNSMDKDTNVSKKETTETSKGDDSSIKKKAATKKKYVEAEVQDGGKMSTLPLTSRLLVQNGTGLRYVSLVGL